MVFFRSMIRLFLTFLYVQILYYRNHSKVAATVILSKMTILNGWNVIHPRANIVNSCIGYASYVGRNSILPNTVIGKYCSIAQNVEVFPYTHPTHTIVSTHPAFFSLLKQSGFTYAKSQLFQEELFIDKEKGIHVKIGNDVWVGANVKIMGGVEIGDGAIIAAGSIVTKSVNPYEIVGGVPAKLIRLRFEPEYIEFLKEVQWWHKSPEWLKDNVDLFLDITILSKVLKKRLGGM